MSDHKRCTSCGDTFEITFMLKDDMGKWVCTWCDREDVQESREFWSRLDRASSGLL